MKISTLIRTFIALGIIAALPLGATAATPKKETTEKASSVKVHPARKHYFAHNWLDS